MCGVKSDNFIGYQKKEQEVQTIESNKESNPNTLKIVQQDGQVIEVDNDSFNYNYYISRLLGKKNDILDNAQYSKCKQLVRRVLLNMAQTQQEVQQTVENEECMIDEMEEEIDSLNKEVGIRRKQEKKGAFEVVDQCVGCCVMDFEIEGDRNEMEIERDRQMDLLVEASYKLKKLEYKLELANKDRETLRKNYELSEQRAPQMEMAIRNLQMQLKSLEAKGKEIEGCLEEEKYKGIQLERKLKIKKDKFKWVMLEKGKVEEELQVKDKEIKNLKGIQQQISSEFKKVNEKNKEYNERIGKQKEELSRIQKDLEEKIRIREKLLKEAQWDLEEERKKREQQDKGKKLQLNLENIGSKQVKTEAESPKKKQKDLSPPKQQDKKLKSNQKSQIPKSVLNNQSPSSKLANKSGQNIEQMPPSEKEIKVMAVERKDISMQTEGKCQDVGVQMEYECVDQQTLKPSESQVKEGENNQEEAIIEKLRQKEETLIKLLTEKEIQLKNIEGLLEALREKYESTKIIIQNDDNNKEELQQQENEIIKEQAERITSLEQVIQKTQKVKKLLKQKYMETIIVKNEVEDKLQILEKEVEKFKKQYQDTTDLYLKQLEEIDKLREEKAILQEEVNKLQNLINELTFNQTKLNQEKVALQSLYKTTNMQHQQLKDNFNLNQRIWQLNSPIPSNQNLKPLVDAKINKEVQTIWMKESKEAQTEQESRKEAFMQTMEEDSLNVSSMVKKSKVKGILNWNEQYYQGKQNNNSSDFDNTIVKFLQIQSKLFKQDVTANYSLVQQQQQKQTKQKAKIFNLSYEEQAPRYSFPKLLSTEKQLAALDKNNLTSLISPTVKMKPKQFNFSSVVKQEYHPGEPSSQDNEEEEQLLDIYHQLSKQFENQKLLQLRKKLFPELQKDYTKEQHYKIKSARMYDIMHLINHQKQILQTNKAQNPEKSFPEFTDFRRLVAEMKQEHKQKCGENCPHLGKFYKFLQEPWSNYEGIVTVKNINKLPGIFLKKNQLNLVSSQRNKSNNNIM